MTTDSARQAPRTVGEALIERLACEGVEAVFGIPGVHTIELYRGLASSPIRHLLPRHEQTAGFMADGYARMTGEPGVCLVITGPGLTNTLTAMGQARQDSVPMLVIAGVNPLGRSGRGLGVLHELPDQRGLAAHVALWARTVRGADMLEDTLSEAFRRLRSERPGPVYVEIPTDVMSAPAAPGGGARTPASPRVPDPARIGQARDLLEAAERPILLLGGGARGCGAAVRALADRLGAPAVMTTNARGLMGRSELRVPASPSLDAVRAEISRADVVLALGTEFGLTDYDFHEDKGLPAMRALIRVDLDPAAATRPPAAAVPIAATVADAVAAFGPDLRSRASGGAQRAEALRRATLEEIGPAQRRRLALLDLCAEILPEAVVVGDSTQPVYAGNFRFDTPRDGGYINSATGYGTLGYGVGAAMGAALATGGPVLCVTGDGGFQFALGELGTLADEALPVAVVVWNSASHEEIADAMRAAGVAEIGVAPTPPDFVAVARAYGLEAVHAAGPDGLRAALKRFRDDMRPMLIEVDAARYVGD